ncbi:hypothetical protein ASC77_11120 [Nocardioides sp. Root1257]|uniref:hypothetical protein n=1 Tax=unclassified Nocardioides TaxID=2615069 RepID=UPI0006FFF372|nr:MULTISPECIES: hypothetical protein [unclassified Nocardioides]KQW49232.1 hypothetical protein ASC77_11120 [Nocardioides sp. Root1257]KRC48406.1 hypothetical protein ASE24_11125 [Nocardioides sp. Root224]
MSLGVRQDGPDTGRRAGDRAATAVPSAARATTPGWRDPRLWVGLLIVAVSVVAGSRLLAAADDTVAVWAVSADAGPGAALTEDDLVVHRVRFSDADDLAGYYRADDTLPADLRLVRAVGAGELLPRGAVGAADQPADSVELPVAVESEQVPPAVHAGSVVDVYLIGDPARGAAASGEPGTPVLREATVVDAPGADDGLGGASGRRQLVLAVPQADAAAYFAAVAALESPLLTVVRRG